MTVFEMLLLLIAAGSAGALNAVVGAGTLITFPTLLALGFPPVVANVSNTIGLVPGAVTAAYAFRATLRGRGELVRRLIVASSVGGITGGALLLALPPDSFEVVVPPLLLLSGVLAGLQPRVARAVARRRATAAGPGTPGTSRTADRSDTPTVTGQPRVSSSVDVPDIPPRIRAEPMLLAGVAATGVYGGYFGAAQGVILLALLGVFIEGGMSEVNGIKNVLAGVANLVSALLFIAIAEVDWTVVAVIAMGASVGGGVGGRYGRRLPAGALRALVVVVAITAAVWRATA